MTKVHHINCGSLHAPPNPKIACHCLLLQEDDRLALVDSGIGLLDVRDPDGRIGRPLIEMVGFQFSESETAVRRIEGLGLDPGNVSDVVLTHADPDHAGGLADFPASRVHVSAEEHAALARGNWRYLPVQFEHAPKWVLHAPSSRRWFGLEARPVDLGFPSEVLLVWLPGHTAGHCGVAVGGDGRWLLHAGDAYYLRVELETDDHPVSAISAARADDDRLRRQSLAALRRLVRDHADEVEVFGYHDTSELPPPPGRACTSTARAPTHPASRSTPASNERSR